MTKPVDRGSLLNGQDRTSRDSRVPFSFPRALDNFSLPDKRARRRQGYDSVHEHVRTQALCKHTGVSISKRQYEVASNKGTFLTTPLSYGVIKWNSDFQLRRGENKTIEFMLRLGDAEELVKNPFQRLADYDTAGPPSPPGPKWSDYEIREAGVYVYDQTILSNHHQFYDGSVDSAGTVTAGTLHDLSTTLVTGSNNFDVFALTALAIGYSESRIFVEYTLVSDVTDAYIKSDPLEYSIGTYVPGAIYHIAIVYDQVDMKLYVDGVLAATNILPGVTWNFCGEYDVINGTTYASGQKRDIVILNECTARASYQSACRVTPYRHGNQTFHHSFSATGGTDDLIPWACSPPRGTAMWDLRIWNDERSAAEVLAWANKRILQADATALLVGNWYLNDGSSVCKNYVDNAETLYCSVHHGYPSYVDNTELLSGIGLKLGDGQHLIRSFVENERDLGVGMAAKLSNVFGYATAGSGNREHLSQNDFTIQIQITVPDAFQQELNYDVSVNSGGAETTFDIIGTESRSHLFNGTSYGEQVFLRDGAVDDSLGTRAQIAYLPAIPRRQCHLAFDQTLWSIEGSQNKNSSGVSIPNESDRRKIPVARGLLNPSGYVIFETYKAAGSGGGSVPTAFRVASTNPLVVGKTYTLTFVQRANYVYDSATRQMNASSFDLEVWIENITDSIAATKDVSYTTGVEGSGNGSASYSVKHKGNYDIIIGASYVNSSWDVGINAYNPDPTANNTGNTSHVSDTVANSRLDEGPWPVTQHFMNPYQDQPGNFVVGLFRLWSVAVPPGDIGTFGSINLTSREHTPDLLVNLEFAEITGVEVPNKSRYPDFFKMGYKGWGTPQGYADQRFTSELNSTGPRNLYLPKPWYDCPWAFEDNLGYIAINSAEYDARQEYTSVKGILPYKSSLAQSYGVAAIYDDCISGDSNLNSIYDPLFLTNHGMLSDITPGRDWYGTVVGDRLVMTSSGGIPKVYNGKHVTSAGFKKWSGGNLLAYPAVNTTYTDLTAEKWYGIVVVYWAEAHGIYHYSPRSVVYLDTGESVINLYYVPQHPDPRVTIVEVYRTPAQDTEDLAKAFPVYKTRIREPEFSNTNASAVQIMLTEGDNDLSLTILDENVTEMPFCEFSAGLNDKLFLGGDPINPDTIYWTDPGNPERIDKIANSLILPEGSGDAVTAMISAFGAVFVFKPNALWRIDDLGGNRHQVTRLFNVGAESQKAVELITDPETGRAMIIYWSKYGPYIFDGQANQYIGGAIEESSYAGSAAAQYNWVDTSSVVIGHNRVAREILFFYKPKRTSSIGTTTILDRNGEAMVYNYRVRSWYRFTGVIGNTAMSLALNITNVSAKSDSPSVNTSDSLLLLGSPNGKIYSWGIGQYDAAPDGLVVSLPLTSKTVTYVGTDEIIVDGLAPTLSLDLLDVWLTLINPDTGDWQTLPIIAQNNSTGSVTVDSDWQINAPFDINVVGKDLLVNVCQPPASVEFPWDELELPFYDKQVVNLITWHDQLCYYKLAYNYDPNVIIKPWSTLTDTDSQRKRTNLAKLGKCEAIKLHLMSFELNAAIDAYAYEVQYNQRGVTPQ